MRITGLSEALIDFAAEGEQSLFSYLKLTHSQC